MDNIKTFFKNQKEAAETINYVINSYWENKIDEKDMIELLKSIMRNNDSLIFKDNEFVTLLKQKCGKRRLEIALKIKEHM
ncbi:MAG: TIGR04540 family protein [Clostridiaceae bacterium]